MTSPRVAVVTTGRPNIGAEVADRNGVHASRPSRSRSAQAVPASKVDGVVIISEYGDYELNEYGQQLFLSAVVLMLR